MFARNNAAYSQGWPEPYIYVGLARTIYLQCKYGNFGREITKYTVHIYSSGKPYIYGVHTVCFARIASNTRPYTAYKNLVLAYPKYSASSMHTYNILQVACTNILQVACPTTHPAQPSPTPTPTPTRTHNTHFCQHRLFFPNVECMI
jgi:hypothetical protein